MSNFNVPNYTAPNSTGLFRFWCQKVLPLVYDDSLSYYELLCKVVNHLNEIVKTVDTTTENVKNLHDSYIELQQYVEHYFDNLDVQTEVNNKLDEMVRNGALNAVIRVVIDEYAEGVNKTFNSQSEKIRNIEADIAVLEERMNTFSSLQNGSTTGDAEIADARVGYDGVVHPSLGVSVREQVKTINNRMGSSKTKNLFDKNTVLVDYYLDAGGIPNKNVNVGMCVSDFIEVETGKFYSVTPFFSVWCYDSGKNPISQVLSCFFPTPLTKYVRLTVDKNDLDKCILVEGYLPSYTNYGEKIAVDSIENTAKELNLFKEEYLTSGYLLTDGTHGTNNDYGYTPFYGGKSGDSFTVTNAFNVLIFDINYVVTRVVGNGTFTLEDNEHFFRATFYRGYWYKATIHKSIGYVEEMVGYMHTTVYVGATRIFKTIGSALNAIADNNEFNRYTILVDPGTYNETFHTKNYVDIVGTNKAQCVIDYVSDNEDDYVNRSTIFGTSYTTLKNLTVKTTGSKYPLHSDGAYGIPYRLICVNCVFHHNGFVTDKTRAGTAVGIGLYHGQHIEMYGCECVASGHAGSASVYCHNNSGNNEETSAYRSLKLDHCILNNGYYGLRLQAIESNNLQDNDCILLSVKNNGKTKLYYERTTKDSWHIFDC